MLTLLWHKSFELNESLSSSIPELSCNGIDWGNMIVTREGVRWPPCWQSDNLTTCLTLPLLKGLTASTYFKVYVYQKLVYVIMKSAVQINKSLFPTFINRLCGGILSLKSHLILLLYLPFHSMFVSIHIYWGK